MEIVQIQEKSNLLTTLKTNMGNSLDELSRQQPVMLIFLRHFGCVFCREALKDISGKRNHFLEKGVKIVFVHLSDDDTAEEYFEKYDLSDIEYISDPETSIYQRFGLTKGSFTQLFGLQVMLRGFEATFVNGNTFSLKHIGDGFQMPGIFLIKDGKIKESYIHKRASDRPDYDQLIDCCTEAK